MSDLFAEAFVEKLILLEQKTGANVQYCVMPPFIARFHDHLSIQNLAKEIAKFIGLPGLTFIVSVAKQKEKVGGQIDLSIGGTDVFITIDPDLMNFSDALVAVVCHEVCHKWLQVKQIKLPIEMENEILTDITTVFLGLGKIMLNGCKVTDIRHETLTNGTRTITNTKTCGYLDRSQFAFVYRLVSKMRNISESDALQGLNAEALQAIQTCDARFGHHYDIRLHRPEAIHDSVSEFHSIITELQRILVELYKHAVYTHHSFLKTLDSFLESSHEKLNVLQKKAAAMAENNEPDPALRFLQSIQKQHEFKRMANEIHPIRDESNGFLRHAKYVCHHLSQNNDRFPPPSTAAFSIVTCPVDGTKISLPDNSNEQTATCPTCKYRFGYNTERPIFDEPVPVKALKLTWRTRLAKLFGK